MTDLSKEVGKSFSLLEENNKLQKQLEAANKESEKLKEAITIYVSNGCHTGDCLHWRYSECEDTLKNEREVLENIKKNGE